MKILIVGADGGIGKGLESHLKQENAEVWSTTKRRDCVGGRRLFLNLSNLESIDEIPTDYSCILLLAAVTSQDECIKSPEKSSLVNVTGTLRIAKRFLASGAHVIFPSTTLVFSGNYKFPGINDVLEPVGPYAAQKASVEKELRSLSPKNTCIVRLSKILQRRNAMFDSWMLDLSKGKTISPFHDLVFSPVTDQFVHNVFSNLLFKRRVGVFHVSAKDDVSYYDAARFLAKKHGFDLSKIQKGSFADSGLIAHAPKYAALDCDSLVNLGFKIPSSAQSLDHFER